MATFLYGSYDHIDFDFDFDSKVIVVYKFQAFDRRQLITAAAHKNGGAV